MKDDEKRQPPEALLGQDIGEATRRLHLFLDFQARLLEKTKSLAEDTARVKTAADEAAADGEAPERAPDL